MTKNNKTIIIASGGTGGHIFPAVSLTNNLKKNGCQVPTLDLGGGIGVYYDSNKKPDFD